MTLVDRNRLLDEVNRQIEQKLFVCSMEVCDCFGRVKQNLQYSILSHRWSGNEVTFDHLQELRKQEPMAKSTKLKLLRQDARLYASIDKLENFLKESKKRQCNYAWADTVCINKDSSAELDESIRSMYGWYRDSRICIVHLSQTSSSWTMRGDPWFTRGWTLQELLAPKQLAFYSKDWMQITTRDSIKRPVDQGRRDERLGKGPTGMFRGNRGQEEGEGLLWPTIAEITGISLDDLHNFEPGLKDIGKRMSWASSRETTRIEDMAYCLIGIFGINLSIAYGEKERAFYRLQVEIMQNSGDMSLFGWGGVVPYRQESAVNSMLAASPNQFFNYSGLRTDQPRLFDFDQTFKFTNVGIRMTVALFPLGELEADWVLERKGVTAFVILGATSESNHRLEPNSYAVMTLAEDKDQPGQYKRLALITQPLYLGFYKKVASKVKAKITLT